MSAWSQGAGRAAQERKAGRGQGLLCICWRSGSVDAYVHVCLYFVRRPHTVTGKGCIFILIKLILK